MLLDARKIRWCDWKTNWNYVHRQTKMLPIENCAPCSVKTADWWQTEPNRRSGRTMRIVCDARMAFVWKAYSNQPIRIVLANSECGWTITRFLRVIEIGRVSWLKKLKYKKRSYNWHTWHPGLFVYLFVRQLTRVRVYDRWARAGSWIGQIKQPIGTLHMDKGTRITHSEWGMIDGCTQTRPDKQVDK